MWEVAPMVEPVSGPTKVEKCGEGCIDVWVRQIGDNYWNAACAFFEASSVYNVVSPEAITDAKLEAVYWDDYIQVFVDGSNVFDTHPNIFQCDAHPPNLRFVLFPFTDVTSLLKSKGQHTLKVKVLVGNGGEGYARIRVHYNPKATLTKDQWSLLNPDCQGLLSALDDGLCSSVNRVCAVDPGVWDSNRNQKCVSYNGVQQICESERMSTIAVPSYPSRPCKARHRSSAQDRFVAWARNACPSTGRKARTSCGQRRR